MISRICRASLVLLCAFASAWGCTSEEAPQQLWIYRDVPAAGQEDKRGDSEKLFRPFGFVPGDRAAQIKVLFDYPNDPRDASQGTSIRYQFELRDRADEWVGACELVNGDRWGSVPGLNVPLSLGVGKDAQLELRFRAKGDGAVVFNAGGIDRGEFRSSLVPAVQVGTGPITLGSSWTEYAIGPISGSRLTNLIDPLCVIALGKDNPGKKEVVVLVDDLRVRRATKR